MEKKGFLVSCRHISPRQLMSFAVFSDPESSSSCVRPYNSFHLLYKSLGMRDKEEYNIRGHLSKEKKKLKW
jgi:hypothetical protein